MSMFRIPVGVAKEIEKLEEFFWGRGSNERSMSTVKWDLIARPKNLGGLGIHSPILRNKSLLAKWLWRMCAEQDTSWARLIKGKYNLSQTTSLADFNIPRRGGVWKDVCKATLGDPIVRSTLQIGWRRRIGNGNDTRFWLDPWVGDGCLKDLFPRLYSISISRTGSVASMGFWNGDNWQWAFVWRRRFFSLEEALAVILFII